MNEASMFGKVALSRPSRPAKHGESNQSSTNIHTANILLCYSGTLCVVVRHRGCRATPILWDTRHRNVFFCMCCVCVLMTNEMRVWIAKKERNPATMRSKKKRRNSQAQRGCKTISFSRHAFPVHFLVGFEVFARIWIDAENTPFRQTHGWMVYAKQMDHCNGIFPGIDKSSHSLPYGSHRFSRIIYRQAEDKISPHFVCVNLFFILTFYGKICECFIIRRGWNRVRRS